MKAEQIESIRLLDKFLSNPANVELIKEIHRAVDELGIEGASKEELFFLDEGEEERFWHES